jgi:hypothetical protein
MGTARRQVRIFNTIDIRRPSARTFGGAEGFELPNLYVNNMLARPGMLEGRQCQAEHASMAISRLLMATRLKRFVMAPRRRENNVAANSFSF